jgi:SAM-dependent methyltransferase
MNLSDSVFRLLQRIRRGIRNRLGAYRSRKADFAAYRHWLKQHPGGNFKEFYVDTIKGYLDGEAGPHSTLGPHPIWEKQGDAILQQLVELGLTPRDVVVDYGCGTLREGIHFIQYLKEGRYIGLDIDERVLEAGRRLMGNELLAEKKPYLAVLNSETATQVVATRPSWIVSSYVLSQMPPDQLDEYLDNLVTFLQAGGKAALQVRLAWRTRQYSKTGWYHNRRRFVRRLAQRGLQILQVRSRRLVSTGYGVRGSDVRLIVGSET